MSDWNGGDDPFKGLGNNSIGSANDRMQTNWKLDEVNRNLRDIKFNQDMSRMERTFDRLNKSGAYTGSGIGSRGFTRAGVYAYVFLNIISMISSFLLAGNDTFLVGSFIALGFLFTVPIMFLIDFEAIGYRLGMGKYEVGKSIDRDMKHFSEFLSNQKLDDKELFEKIQNLLPKMNKIYGKKAVSDYSLKINDNNIWKKENVNIFELALKSGKYKAAKTIYVFGIFSQKKGEELIESSKSLSDLDSFNNARGSLFGSKDDLIKNFQKSLSDLKVTRKKTNKINDYNSWCIKEGKDQRSEKKSNWTEDPSSQIHNTDLLGQLDSNTQEFYDISNILVDSKVKTTGDVDYSKEEKEFEKEKTASIVQNFSNKNKEKDIQKESKTKAEEIEVTKVQEKALDSKIIFEEMKRILIPTMKRDTSSFDNHEKVRDHLLRTLEMKKTGFEINGLLIPMSVLKNKRIDYLILPKDPIHKNLEEFNNLEVSEVSEYFKNLQEKLTQFMNGEEEITSQIDIAKENAMTKRLDSIIGQTKAKEMIKEIISLVKVNKARALNNMETHNVNLHTVFSGSPGTGKTTFARIFADCIKSLGVLSKGHLVEVSRSDLVASYVGQTAIKTTEKFNEALGGVLFIDEAYSLKTGDNDQYGSECIDTLNKLIEDNRDDIVIILAGYQSEMREFLGHNTGLKSRIPNAVTFEDFQEEELKQIMKLNFKEKGFEANEKLIGTALREVLKGKKGGHFGNARAVRNLVERVIKQQSIRLTKNSEITKENLKEIWASDITECSDDHQKEIVEDQSMAFESKAMEKLESLIGLRSVKEIIGETKDLVEIEKIRNPENPLSDQTLHMAFAGNPGTGKTTVARLIGEIFQDLEILPTGHVVEVDRSKLVGKHVGETAQITKKCLEEALGGVLFVDEAYTLLGDGQDYGQEAIDTILKFMEDHRDKLIVIFAGYNDEIHSFLESNPGLRSRVSNILKFDDYSHDELFEIAKIVIAEKSLKASDDVLEKIVKEVEEEKASDTHFANARSIRNIIEKIKKKQASRLVLLKREDKLSKDDVFTIKLEDVA
jgi:replication-associated recombination protein RarA